MDKGLQKEKKKVKLIIELFFFIPLIIIAFVLYYFIDKEVSKRMIDLKAEILSYMEKQLGRKIQYESISPSVFMYLEIRDLRIYSLVSYEDELFRIRNIKIKYNIFKLAFSDDPLSSVSEIKISNTLFKFHLDPDKYSVRTDFQRTFLSRLTSTTYKFRITANNVSLLLYTDTALINSTNLFFTIRSINDHYEINVRKGNTRVTFNNNEQEPLWFFSRFKIKGSLYTGFDKADLIVRILHLSSNNFILEKQTFQIVLKDKNLSVIKIQDKAPVDIELSFDFPTRELNIDFKTENWKPSSMIKLTGPLYSYNPWLNSGITSGGNIHYDIEDKFIDYTISSSILLNNPILPNEIVVSTYVYGDQEIAYFKPLVIHSQLGTIDFTGNILFKNFFPEGFLRFVNVKTIQNKRLSADFTLDRYENNLSVKGSRLYIGSSGFDKFNLDISPRLNSLFFELRASFAQSLYDDIIYAEGELEIEPTLSIKVDGKLIDIPASNLYKLFTPDAVYSAGIYRYLERLTLGSEYKISSDFKLAQFYTKYFFIKDTIKKENEANLNIRGTEKELVIDSIQAHWEKFDLEGDVLTQFNQNNRVTFESNLYLEDIPYGITGYYEKGKRLLLSGNYGLNLSVLFNQKNETNIYAKALKLPFPLSGEKKQVAYTSFDIKGTYPEDGKWQIISPSTIFYDLPFFEVKNNEIDVSYVFNKEQLYISKIEYNDFLSELTGSGDIRFGVYEDTYMSGSVSLSGINTKEYYEISTLINSDSINALIVFTNSPLKRFGEFIISGSLTGSVTVSGSLDQPEFDGNISLVKGSLVGDYVGFNTDFHIKGAEISFQDFDITYLSLNIIEGNGVYNKENGKFRFSAIFKGDYFHKELYCDLLLYGDTSLLSSTEPFDRAFSKDINAMFDISGIKVDNMGFNPWSVLLTKKDDILSINGGPDDVLAGTFMNNGEFEIKITTPFPVQGVVKGNVTGNTIDSEIEEIWIDSNVLNVILGEDIIRFNQGYASGKNIKVSGFFNDPDFNGTLVANDVAISFYLSPVETKPFQCTLSLNEKELEMEKIAAQAGSGYVYVDKGIFYIDHWLPTAYDMIFRSDDDIGLYCSYDFDSVKVNGFAKGTVHTRGDKDTVWVDGDIIAHYCTITLSNPKETKDTDSEDPLDLMIDLSFESGRKVEFDWPTSNFPVLKCYAEKGSKLQISYDSDLDKFNMNGNAAIKGGEVFYFNRNFYLKSGNIVFNVVNPDEVDPTVSVQAELREFTTDEEEVKIYLIAENNRLSEFSPRFESSPNMSEYAIYELLGKSLENRIEESGLGLSVLLISSEVLSEAIIFRSFEETVRDIFNIDLFSIRTHVIENILMDRVIGVETEEDFSGSSLGKYLDNTTITIGQYIGEDLFIKGLVRLTEVDYYTPETLFGSGFFGIEPELEFSLEWPTPFFNLEWTFNPTQEHLNDLFLYLTDNTIKFEWSYSY